jgi:hypothetical protein
MVGNQYHENPPATASPPFTTPPEHAPKPQRPLMANVSPIDAALCVQIRTHGYALQYPMPPNAAENEPPFLAPTPVQ